MWSPHPVHVVSPHALHLALLHMLCLLLMSAQHHRVCRRFIERQVHPEDALMCSE
jgi:hypothetical protein